VRRPDVRLAFARLAFVRPAFDELGVRDEDEGVRVAVEGWFDRLFFEGAVDRLVLDRFVDPERAGLERFVRPLDREAPRRDPPRR